MASSKYYRGREDEGMMDRRKDPVRDKREGVKK